MGNIVPKPKKRKGRRRGKIKVSTGARIRKKSDGDSISPTKTIITDNAPTFKVKIKRKSK